MKGTVAITGAASGIGRALAEEAVRRGATALALIDVDIDAADRVAGSLRSTGAQVGSYACDVEDADALDDVVGQVVDTFGVPRLVCANAGVCPPTAALFDIEPDDMRWVLGVNAFGTWATLRAFGRRLVAHGEPGWLLVTGSEHSIGVPFPGLAGYTASKHAVLGLADVLRRELPEHVGISVLVPGVVASAIWRGAERRPDRFGGSGPPDDAARMVISHGMPPSELAAIALEGVAAGEFVIASHHHARRYAQAREAEVGSAFDRLLASGRREVAYAIEDVAAAAFGPAQTSAPTGTSDVASGGAVG